MPMNSPSRYRCCRRRRPATTRRYLPLAFLVLSSPRHSVTAAATSTYHHQNGQQQQDELPLTNRLPFKLQRRYASKNNVPGGYIFLKHLRKTGGTTLRTYLEDVMVYYRKLELERQQQNHDTQRRKSIIGNITYYEQEFYAMDWQCPTADADRWRDTLSVVALRHPIERHLSEFFFSGPGSKGKLKELHKSGNYNDEFAHLMRIELPKWIEEGIIINSENGCLRRHFSDNFQVRALGGHVDMAKGDLGPLPYTRSPQQSCSVHKWSNDTSTNSTPILVHNEHCGNCSDFCDGPCSYGMHWRGGVHAGGVVTKQTRHRAMDVLAKFDVVLLTETMGEDDQVQLLADVTGVPIVNASLAADRKNIRSSGHGTTTVEQKYHYYQDIINNAAPDTMELLEDHSAFEMDLYAKAVRINSQLTLQWRKERAQQDKEHADTG